MIVYNLFPLLAGACYGWKAHFERAADMGFDWVFVNPIQYPGMSGSLYSVKDYFRFNPLIIDDRLPEPPEEQVRLMVKDAEALGLKLMVDLVINHCAIDADIIKEHREWFVWEGDEVAHPSCDENGQRVVWGDLAKFDHAHTSDPEGLYRFIRSTMDYLMDLGFKGFRCDAAYQVPRPLWERLIRDVKNDRGEEIVFAAETLGCTADQTRETAEAGFDYVFNSCKWWDFQSPWLMEQYNLIRETAPSIGFPESHDTERLMEELQGNEQGVKQRYLFAALFATGVMMPVGFEFGFRKRLHVVETRPEDWEDTDTDLTDFIRAVNAIKREHPVFREECPMNIMQAESNPHVLMMWRGSRASRQEGLVILNKDVWSHQTFYAPKLREWVQSGAPLTCISPDNPMEHVAQPFTYDLRPGEGLVFVTER